jgi:hypothetical protein
MMTNGTCAYQVARNGVGPRDELGVAANSTAAGSPRPGELLATSLVRPGRRIVQTVSTTRIDGRAPPLRSGTGAIEPPPPTRHWRDRSHPQSPPACSKRRCACCRTPAGAISAKGFLLGLDSPDGERRLAQSPSNGDANQPRRDLEPVPWPKPTDSPRLTRIVKLPVLRAFSVTASRSALPSSSVTINRSSSSRQSSVAVASSSTT